MQSEHLKIPVYLANFFIFCKDCLGYKDLIQEHKELCKFMQFNESKSKLILMPRYSFKSSIVTIAYALWRLGRNPDMRILIYSDSATKAQAFLQGIKNLIMGQSEKSTFSKCFPNWQTDPHSGKWNESQIIISERKESQVEPSVDTGGIETTKVGMHYDLIIFDDIVSDLNTTTKAQMDKTYECYAKSLSLLKPGGDVIITGTRWNYGDAYGRIIAEGSFSTFIKRAEVNGNYPFSSIGLTEEFLADKKKQQGSYQYNCLYNNSPVDDSTALFKMSEFRFYGNNIDQEKMFITCTCDPAGEGDDFTAITVVGTDEKLRMYLLHAVNEHLKPDQIVRKILELNYIFKYDKFGIENNFFRGMLEKELRLAIEYERENKNFKPFGLETFIASAKRGEGKHARILSLQPYHERGDILFPGNKFEDLKGAFAELAYQMIQYTQAHRPVHDDLCLVEGTKISTINGDIPIEDIRVGDCVITPFGLKKVLFKKMTGYKNIIEKMGLMGTGNHKVFTYNDGEKRLDTLSYHDNISILSRKEMCQWIYKKVLYLMESPINLWVLTRKDIILASQIQIKEGKILKDFMWRFGNLIIKSQFLKVMKFTTKTLMYLITTQVIWNVYLVRNIVRNIILFLWKEKNGWSSTLKGLGFYLRNGIVHQREEYGIERMLKRLGRIRVRLNVSAFIAERSLCHGFPIPFFVQGLVDKQEEGQKEDGLRKKFVNIAVKNLLAGNTLQDDFVQDNVPLLLEEERRTNPARKVYNLKIEESGMYFANGILVSNCDSLAYHIKLIQRGDGGGVDAIPEDCIMAILERQRKEFIEKQKFVPRALRQYPKPVFA